MKIATPSKKSHPLFPSNPRRKVEVLSSSRSWKFGWKLNPPAEMGAHYVNQHSFLWNHPTEPWYNMLETLEIQRENRWYEIVSKTHSTCLTWRLSGASQWGSQISSCPSPSVGFKLRIFQIFVLPVIPLGQPPRMKKKDNKKNNI